MPRPSRAKLLQIDADPPEQPHLAADPRASAAQELRRERHDALESIRTIFAGTTLQEDERRLHTLLALRGEIVESWTQARDAFLHIGRTLNRLDTTLTSEERNRLRDQSARLFPFSEGVASQLRQVALAVDDGRLPASMMPGSYSVAYQLTLLTPTQMALARERGLLRPDVTRQAIIQFRRETEEHVAASHRQTLGKNRLRSELLRLQSERRSMLQALVAVRRRIREITGILKGPAM